MQIVNREKIKILVVGDPSSIHTARFTNLLKEIGYSVDIFQSEFCYAQDGHLAHTNIHVAFAYVPAANGNIILGFYRITSFLLSLFNKIKIFQQIFLEMIHFFYKDRQRVRSSHLVRLLTQIKPDVIFSLKMQNDGYTVSQAKQIMGKENFPKWVHFNWGTDIEFFGKDPNYKQSHLPKISTLLSQCDYFIADCERDAHQVAAFGFHGVNLGTSLSFGGFNLNELEAIKAQGSKRNVILVKGREGGYIGKGLNILMALHKISSKLYNYKIKIILSTPIVAAKAKVFSQEDGINYEILGRLPYQQLLELNAQSLIAISATDIDGTPSFLVEAMAMGAFPIHSDMSSIREWITNKYNGFLFPVDDIESLSRYILLAITSPDLINKARERNWKIVSTKMNRDKIRKHFESIIENQILGY